MIISQNILVPGKPQQNVLREMSGNQLETAAVSVQGRSSLVSLCKGILPSSHCFALLLLFAVCSKQLEQGNVVLFPCRLCRSFSKELEVHRDPFSG